MLDRADLAIPTGQFVVLLGKSGSGKSTLLQLLAGIDTPDEGEVVVEGTALTSLDDRGRTLFRRRSLGFVFQFFNLLPTLTVLENLGLALELKGVAGQAQEMLAAVGLADRARHFPDRLSGGEQQRVAVARALVHDPAMVLADEPTGNLDEETGGQVLDLLVRMTRERGRTLVMATHNAEIAERADRVLRLQEGRLVG